MKHAPIVALALAGALVAGCGGGSSISQEEYDELKQELEDTQDELTEAEGDRDRAQQEATNERNRANQAEGQLQGEQEARQEAEARADDLEEEAGHTASQLVQANARQVYAGLEDYIDDATTDNTRAGTADPAVTPRYRESALVTTAPVVTFSSTTTGTSGKWFRTSLSNRAFTHTDRLDVYSDAEAPDSVSFTSIYNADTETIVGRYLQNVNDPGTTIDDTAPGTVVDDNKVVGSVQISVTGTPADRDDASASAFPKSGEAREDFDQDDRGFTLTEFEALADEATRAAFARRTLEQYTALGADTAERYARLTFLHRNLARYPLRFTEEVSGRLGGASGTFTCASAAEADCRVTNQNTHFRFVGPWVFTPSSASATVRVDDKEFMYFGWWARQDNSDGTWTFRTFHGPTGTGADGNRSTALEISRLSGTAIYRGPAVGQYSFYEPNSQQSEYGEFSATATLTADFGAETSATDGTLHGTIDEFEGHPDWTLTLKQAAISDSAATATNATAGVSWQIDGEAVAAPDAGGWEAAFYSNLPADSRTTTTPDEDAVPTGIAGTFEAEYHHVGRMIGAFGAHKQP